MSLRICVVHRARARLRSFCLFSSICCNVCSAWCPLMTFIDSRLGLFLLYRSMSCRLAVPSICFLTNLNSLFVLAGAWRAPRKKKVPPRRTFLRRNLQKRRVRRRKRRSNRKNLARGAVAAAVAVIMMAAPMASAVVVRDDTARIVTVIAAAWLLQFLSRRILPNTPTVLTR